MMDAPGDSQLADRAGLSPVEYMDLLATYGRELALTLDVPRIYELALDGILALSGAAAALICLRERGGPAWRVPARRHLDAELAEIIGMAAESQLGDADATLSLPAITPNYDAMAAWRDLQTMLPPAPLAVAAEQGLRVLLTLRLEPEGPLLLHLLAPDVPVPSGARSTAMRLFLDQVRVTLRNARLYLETVRWAQRMGMLQSTGAAIGATLDLPTVLRATVRCAVDLVEASFGALALWDSQARTLRLEASTTLPALLDTGRPAIRLGEGLAGRAAQDRRALVLRDYQQWEYGVSSTEPAVHALVAIPLLWQDELFGVLEVGEYRADRAFSDEDISLLMLLGQQAASAIANARLYERAQQRLRQLTVLQDTSRAIISQLDYDQVLRTVLGNASSLLGTHMGAVFVPDEKQEVLTIRTAVGLSEAFVRETRVAHGEGCVGQVMVSARPVEVYDVRAEPLTVQVDGDGMAPEFRSILAVPLISQGRVLGVLCVYGEAPRHWSPVEAELLLVFASQAANAMQNALLFERLRAEKATLTTTIQSMSDGLIVTDAAGDIILANPVADRMFNVPFTASIGMNLLQALALSPYPLEYGTGDQPADLLRSVLGEGTVYRGELNVRRAERMTLEFSFLPVIGAGYIITGGLAVFHDITELRRLSELKTDFISMVSHELRTPLTSIKGFVKLVLVEDLGPLTAQQRECLAVADAEADRLTHLINDLLDVSRIDAGRMTFTWEVLHPNDLVEQVMQTLHPQAAELNLHLEAALPENLPPIRGDRQRIIQILTNLLGNAVKFTPAGGRVRVAAAVESGLLVVRVADTGVGIPAHAMPRIFDRFYQVDGAGPRSRGGTGLGLAITRQLVELHGGRIWASSTLGEGSTFTFTLPIAAH
jgi:signal transduction histidine kinase/putative methionine-R-sulfoxide reductase with GAF domain